MNNPNHHNNQPHILTIAGFKSYLVQSWHVSKQISKAYRITTLVMIIVGIMLNASLLSTFDLSTPAQQRAFLFRSIIDPLLFISICHFMVRPYLKLKVIHRSFNRKSMLQLNALLLLAGFCYFIGVYLIGSTDSLNDASFQKMQLVNDKGEVDAIFSEPMIWIIGILNSFLMFVMWAIVYLMWHQQQSKKVLQKQVQTAQMQQLTNQLSPHFLFNTFNSIRALIYEDRDKAAETVTELSELFRTHLQAHLRVKSTLEEEWQVSQRYLGIEQIRLEERLTIDCDIEPQLWSQSLPTLTLLTLIENAIKHGISPNADNGFVRIQAKLAPANRWTLTVCNSFKPGSNTTGTQVGLANIKSRLAFMHAEQFEFNQDISDNQFKVSLTLPIETTKPVKKGIC